MPLRSDWSDSSCPLARSLDAVGDPWTLLILREAFTGSRRYEQFRSGLGMADNVLSRRLRTMVDDGLLRRVPYKGARRTHDEYHLTEAGSELLPVLHALLLWGERHTPAPAAAAHVEIIHSRCGQVSSTAEVCSACGERLAAGEVAWRRPWLAPEPVALAAAGD